MRRRILLNKSSSIDTNNYLTIVALEDGLTAQLSINACEYCVDGDDNWKSLAAGTATESINSGHTLSFRGELTPTSNNGIGTFTISKKCNLKGNCMSMLFKDNANNNDLSDKSHAFLRLFGMCSTIINVSSDLLPATILSYGCYYSMFYGCTSLVSTPKLPAMSLGDVCYGSMFRGCTSLTNAPELPAMILANSCYSQMFYGCNALITAPQLPATTLASSCYNGMFGFTNVLPDCSNIDFTDRSVTVSGGLKGLFTSTVVTDNDLFNILPINEEGRYCLPVGGDYYRMFYDCRSLITAPELPATTLMSYCYYDMFRNCTSLTVVPKLPATNLSQGCYEGMFASCISLTEIPENLLPATTMHSSCYDEMFRHCNALTTIPEGLLPATTLTYGCYSSMFANCVNLTSVPENLLPATTVDTYCYHNMFSGCKSLIIAPELPATKLGGGCYQSMFSGCSNLSYIKAMFTTTPSDTYTSGGVSGVSSIGTFIKNADATWDVTGTNGVPEGWTIEYE